MCLRNITASLSLTSHTMHDQLKDERVRKNHELDERARTILELDERRSLSPSSSIDERDERNEGNQPRDELWEVGLMFLYRSRLTVKM